MLFGFTCVYLYYLAFVRFDLSLINCIGGCGWMLGGLLGFITCFVLFACSEFSILVTFVLFTDLNVTDCLLLDVCYLILWLLLFALYLLHLLVCDLLLFGLISLGWVGI